MSVDNLIVESSPHVFSANSKTKTMWLVIVALLPATLVGIYNFGLPVLWILLTSILTATLTEAVFNKLRGKPTSIIHGAAIITGLLLALTLPPTVPLWIPVVGAFIAIALAKHAFGGAGCTLFNPALVGRAFLVVSFPVIMSNYIWPTGWDAITSATPLQALKYSGYESTITMFGGKMLAYKSLLLGNIAGTIGEASALALLIGGLFLIYKKVVDWKIPTIYIGTVFVFALLMRQDPLFHVLGGGLMIGAFFMATDYGGMPITQSGRIYFALGLGILTSVIRFFGGYPEGVNFAILLMNAASPMIERLTIKKPFGYIKKKNKKETKEEIKEKTEDKDNKSKSNKDNNKENNKK